MGRHTRTLPPPLAKRLPEVHFAPNKGKRGIWGIGGRGKNRKVTNESPH